MRAVSREGVGIVRMNGDTRRRWRIPLLAIGLGAGLLLAAACGGNDDDGDSAGDGRLSGGVAVDGSSTVFPVTEAVAQEFQKLHGDVRVTVGVSGTGGGFEKFCSGETDISDASRPIKESERDACAGNGVEWIELRVGLDGLVVVTNPEADFLDSLTLDELRTIWAPEAEGSVTRWSQVRSSFHDQPIELFGPDTDSGTFDFFTEEINGEGGASRGDYTPSTDDNVLVVGVSGTDSALAYFGYAYYANNSDRLKIVPIDAGNGPVAPSNATVADGSYPLARPLFIYVNTASLAEEPQVREFVRFYLTDAGIALVEEVEYTAIPQAELQSSREVLEAAIAAGAG